ncbi:TUBA3 [Symbiodinium necroappetens]|uniref:TUBA3 protein n=1 Tax=Symbiodinium necroappetens TaxID=1628268 RepID=A0A813CEM7_9DINO|nr:TUBA3 [Symbiodinium sp. KB8]CAE7793559.1 TUBA3 [Symbiodinium microadriaticum]CAE7941572.1 TUBA3 [Symbiodinium necroappetens]
MSERSCVEVNPKHPVPLPPKLKPMDHWDLIVAFDTHKFRKEYEAYVKAHASYVPPA